ncbi:MAG TPA: DUF6265 family protein [Ignavibacteria bacterium]|nr:DUF6265 family protein [Ignavibacteria bacterium]
MNENNFLKLLWITGQWEGIQGSGIYHEEWEKISDSELKGKAYMIKKGEIINNELLKIHEEADGIYYTADVSHNPSPVSFKLTEITDSSFIFENPEHDFPQKISYVNENDVKLKAVVEAVVNGKLKKIEFDLRRIV